MMDVADATVGGPTPVTAGNSVQELADITGRVIVHPLGGPQSYNTGGVKVITTVTETTVLAGPGANLRREMTWLCIANRDNVAHTIDIRMATGAAVAFTVIVAAGLTQFFDFSSGMPQSTMNSNITAQLRETATTGVEIACGGYTTKA